jgi:hypothetical protein
VLGEYREEFTGDARIPGAVKCQRYLCAAARSVRELYRRTHRAGRPGSGTGRRRSRRAGQRGRPTRSGLHRPTTPGCDRSYRRHCGGQRCPSGNRHRVTTFPVGGGAASQPCTARLGAAFVTTVRVLKLYWRLASRYAERRPVTRPPEHIHSVPIAVGGSTGRMTANTPPRARRRRAAWRIPPPVVRARSKGRVRGRLPRPGWSASVGPRR